MKKNQPDSCSRQMMQRFPGLAAIAAPTKSVMFHAALAMIFLLVPGSRTALAQQQSARIVDVVWGFDGRVVTSQFVPLSILVDNLSDEPIEASAELRCMARMRSDVGGVISQPVFLGPNSRRWVQFYPYISGESGSWYLTLLTAERKYTFDAMDQPRSVLTRNQLAAGADQALPVVILDPSGSSLRLPTTVKHMPAEIFPPYAPATHGLSALFLDHVPDWELPRQEALLSWLKIGGRLHLLQDSNNQTLRFSGILAPLNEPFPEYSVGVGRVIRHDIQRQGLNSSIVDQAVTSLYVRPKDESEGEDAGVINPYSQSLNSSRTVDDSEILTWLRDVTQPDHSWIVIFLLSLVYVGLIFPGCWILSKKRTLHFLVTYGAITGLALLFSVIFLIIGRRGYGESTSFHTLAVARAEDDTHWDLLQYNTLFVTRGDRYQIDAKDQQILFSSGAPDERTDAAMVSGNSGSFTCRVPPFSSESIVCRRRLTLDDWGLAVTGFSVDAQSLTGLTVTFNDKFPAGEGVKCFAVFGNQIWPLGLNSSKRELFSAEVGTALVTFCAQVPDYSSRSFSSFFFPNFADGADEDPVTKCFRKSLPALITRSAMDDFVDDISRFQLPADRLRLLVYAPVPPQLDLQVSAEARRDGRVLYVRDLLLQRDSRNTTDGADDPDTDDVR